MRTISVRPENNEVRLLYLELLKQCLTYSIWGECDYPIGMGRAWFRYVQKFLKKFKLSIVKEKEYDPQLRENGRDVPLLAHTMIGLKRLNNIQYCAEEIIKNNIEGDFIETGVWRGGACIFMRGILKAYGVTNRSVWVADSFEGLPEPNTETYPQDIGSTWHLQPVLQVTLEQVKDNFSRYGLLDEQVHFLKGWFRDTLPKAPIEKLALLRLDGDMYESTMDALSNLYPKLSPGGFVIIDDYCLDSCVQAVRDFRRQSGIDSEIVEIDWSGVFWQKQ
jgi:O-methyltransferase